MTLVNTVEGYMNHFFTSVVSQEDVKERAGIRYLSSNWDDYPYWYLWLTETRGVYKLELIDAGDEAGFDWVANFKVKYYPRKDEPAFRQLSVLEQICRTGEAFHTLPSNTGGCPLHSCSHDHDRFSDLKEESGVPHIAYQVSIPADFFYTGNILLAYKEQVGSIFTLLSQSRWRVIISQDWELADESGGQMVRLHKGTLDRDYPGKVLTDALLRRILAGWNLFQHYQFATETIHARQGVEFLFDGVSLQPKPADAVTEYRTEIRMAYSSVMPMSMLLPDKGASAGKEVRM